MENELVYDLLLKIDLRLRDIERRVGAIENQLLVATTSWKSYKKVATTIIAILGGLLTLNWEVISKNWSNLFN